MTRVFIDGSAGTTGLRILDRLQERQDIELIILPDAVRKDKDARKQALNSADIVFLCLPDEAARESVSLIENANTAVIDTSTAHRTSPDWVYGFPELSGYREKIRHAKRIANPGCHASGFIALVQPLVQAGILDRSTALTCFSVTGYSGGGKKMIAAYEDAERSGKYNAPRQYGLNQNHKHLKEMTMISGLETAPLFSPIVADYYAGMCVTVPVSAKDLKGSAEDVKAVYKAVYHTDIVHYEEYPDTDGMVSANALASRDDMEILVQGNEERILLISRFDNLGKGASGAAIQNMNILLGLDEKTGLVIKEG